jgi:hypothetical protein
MKLKLLGAAATLVLGMACAQAATAQSFTDTFTGGANPSASGASKLNWTGDNFFTPVPPAPSDGTASVDLVTAADFPTYYGSLAPFDGLNAIDLDGTTAPPTGSHPAGEIQSVSLAAGDYYVQFYLAGNNVGSGQYPVDPIDVSLGGYNQVYTPASYSQGFVKYGFYVDTTSASTLNFTDIGTQDNVGSLLADVSVSAAPEPATWALMFFGVALAGGALRLSRQRRPITLAI